MITTTTFYATRPMSISPTYKGDTIGIFIEGYRPSDGHRIEMPREMWLQMFDLVMEACAERDADNMRALEGDIARRVKELENA